MADIKGADMGAIEKEEDAESDQHRGPYQAADGAAMAVTAKAVAHVETPFSVGGRVRRAKPKTFPQG